MIEFISQNDFKLTNTSEFSTWLSSMISEEGYVLGHLSLFFCSDEQLLEMNIKYLKHDTFTDVITFDYNHGNTISGDICISIDRVRDNAETFGASFVSELSRVMAHGVLHLCGYKDKTETEKQTIRSKENHYLSRFSLLR
jgi:rRNA maturation RNase YbeY